jgi:serine/threonine protein phosphatase 1
MTRYAIGDIHGGCKTFRALLDKLNLRQGDRIYLMGDYVDRGNDSRGVLDTILHLMDSGYDVRPVRGNHDDMMLRTFNEDHDGQSKMWLKCWGEGTLQSFGVRRISDLPLRYLTLLDALPLLQMDDNFIFVHASLDMYRDDPLTQSSRTDMLWGEIRTVDSAKIGGRKLVTGHNIRPLQLIKASLSTSKINLDNGAFTNMQPEMGNLVALNLDTMNLTIQKWLDGAARD